MEEGIRKKILALYIGARKVKKVPYSEEFWKDSVVVKSLEMLDKADMWHLTLLLDLDEDGDFEDMKVEVLKIFEPGSSHFWDIGYTPFIYLQVADFLRGRNYAIPAYGYTVEQLEEELVFRYSHPDDDRKQQTFKKFGTPIEGAPAEDNSLKKKSSRSLNIEQLLNKGKE